MPLDWKAMEKGAIIKTQMPPTTQPKENPRKGERTRIERIPRITTTKGAKNPIAFDQELAFSIGGLGILIYEVRRHAHCLDLTVDRNFRDTDDDATEKRNHFIRDHVEGLLRVRGPSNVADPLTKTNGTNMGRTTEGTLNQENWLDEDVALFRAGDVPPTEPGSRGAGDVESERTQNVADPLMEPI
ncbi:hypothetical protein BDZ91DRAFT_793519 [Kalaharituber pfeilii]|nr:hypothetical protein BDZ91DRAFT_793519 [Kalaharituber pfeilii]